MMGRYQTWWECIEISACCVRCLACLWLISQHLPEHEPGCDMPLMLNFSRRSQPDRFPKDMGGRMGACSAGHSVSEGINSKSRGTAMKAELAGIAWLWELYNAVSKVV